MSDAQTKAPEPMVFVWNKCKTWINTPAQSYELLPGPNMFRASAWLALVEAKEPLNGLPSVAADGLRARLKDGTLRVEEVHPEFAASLGQLDRAAALALLGKVFRPSMLRRWFLGERRATVREAIGKRLCLVRGCEYSIEVAADLAGDTDRDELLLRRLWFYAEKLFDEAGFRDWQPTAPAPGDDFAPDVGRPL